MQLHTCNTVSRAEGGGSSSASPYMQMVEVTHLHAQLLYLTHTSFLLTCLIDKLQETDTFWEAYRPRGFTLSRFPFQFPILDTAAPWWKLNELQLCTQTQKPVRFIFTIWHCIKRDILLTLKLWIDVFCSECQRRLLCTIKLCQTAAEIDIYIYNKNTWNEDKYSYAEINGRAPTDVTLCSAG